MRFVKYCDNIREYVDSTDAEIRDDFENHIFEIVWYRFTDNLPTKEDHENDTYNAIDVWFDGEEILCRTEDIARRIADILDDISGEKMSHYHYYDPEEDQRNNEVDDHTGWWYVDYD